MKIHTDRLTMSDLFDAAKIARVEFDRLDQKGSRSRARAFDFTLTGESRRRPNNRGQGDPDAYAATWDQWGVFLAVLFDRDDERTFEPSQPMSCTYYADRAEFIYRTNARFTKIGGGWDNHWPHDEHGDHRFKFAGTPFEQSCTKCSAVTRWR